MNHGFHDRYRFAYTPVPVNGHRPRRWHRAALWLLTGWRLTVLLCVAAPAVTWLIIR